MQPRLLSHAAAALMAFLLVPAASSAAKGIQYGGHVTLGWSMLGLADLDTVSDNLNVNIAQNGQTGTSRFGSGGVNYGLMGNLYLPSNWGFGLGYSGELISGVEADWANTISGGTVNRERSLAIRFSQSIIPLTGYYRHYLGNRIFINGVVGIDIVNATLDYTFNDRETVIASGAVQRHDRTTAIFNSSGLGFHLGVDGEYGFTEHVFGFLGLHYMVVGMSNFTGNRTDADLNSSLTTAGWTATMRPDAGTGLANMRLAHPTLAPSIAGDRPFRADGSGIRLEAGARFLFP